MVASRCLSSFREVRSAAYQFLRLPQCIKDGFQSTTRLRTFTTSLIQQVALQSVRHTIATKDVENPLIPALRRTSLVDLPNVTPVSGSTVRLLAADSTKKVVH